MKLSLLLLILVSIVLLNCTPADPTPPSKPQEAFNITIDGNMIATGPATAVLYNDYLLINTYGEYDFTFLIHLSDALPAAMGLDQYSSLTMTDPDMLMTNVEGGSGQVYTLNMNMTEQLVNGTFIATLINPDNAADLSNITEANFSSVYFRIAADTSQIYGELSQVMDGIDSKANLVYATDTSSTEASMLANAHDEYEVQIKNIPKTPGVYSFQTGSFYSASDASVMVNIFDDDIYSDVVSGTLEVLSYDPVTFELQVSYNVTVEKTGGDEISISNGFAKFYTGGIH